MTLAALMWKNETEYYHHNCNVSVTQPVSKCKVTLGSAFSEHVTFSVSWVTRLFSRALPDLVGMKFSDHFEAFASVVSTGQNAHTMTALLGKQVCLPSRTSYITFWNRDTVKKNGGNMFPWITLRKILSQELACQTSEKFAQNSIWLVTDSTIFGTHVNRSRCVCPSLCAKYTRVDSEKEPLSWLSSVTIRPPIFACWC